MRADSAAEAKGVLGDNITFGPMYDAQVIVHQRTCGIDVLIESVSNNGSRTWVVISRGVDRFSYVAELLVECNQSMYTDAVLVQNESFSTEHSVLDMETRGP